MLGVFACFAIGYDLGKRLKQEAVVSASMATLIFLMIQLSGPPMFSARDIANLPSLAERLTRPDRPVDTWLADQLSDETKAALKVNVSDQSPLKTSLLHDLNTIIRGSSINETQRFAGVALRSETKELLSQNPQGNDLLLLNRLMLEDAYPQELSRHRPTLGERPEDISFSMGSLGSKGLFIAIMIALITVRVQKFFTDKNFVIKLPANVPPVVYESFLSLSPLFFLVLVFWLVRFVLGVDINAIVQTAFKPLVFALNTARILTYAFLVRCCGPVASMATTPWTPSWRRFSTLTTLAMTHGPLLRDRLRVLHQLRNVGGAGSHSGVDHVDQKPGFRNQHIRCRPDFRNQRTASGFPIVLNPFSWFIFSTP
jgi:hypothetical protein